MFYRMLDGSLALAAVSPMAPMLIAQQVAVAVPYFVLQFAIAAAACALLSRNSLSVLLSPLARFRPRLLQHSQHC